MTAAMAPTTCCQRSWSEASCFLPVAVIWSVSVPASTPRDCAAGAVTWALDAICAYVVMRWFTYWLAAYAESGWHLRHTGDWTRALAVFTAMQDRLDLEWMRLEAARRGQGEVIERVLRREPLVPPRLP